ncbi:hypothetical protein AB0M28_05250 [Streptomyces sp. NPDC051940]|uniref:hypothetical protein n=1 Tax=Streptomyces sp. NPDC051940 TaxID=3155675 RepID=UPI0034396638
MRVRRWGRAAVVAGAVAGVLALAGCGGSGGDGGGGDEIASAGKGKPSATSTTKAVESALSEYVEAQREWVGCMREAGVDLPDPDAKGNVEIDIPIREWKSDPKYITAQEKCQAPTIPDDLEKALQPELTDKEKDQHRRYAECMQENGAPDFPDVGEDGYYVEENWDSTSESAKLAARTCDKSVFGVDTSTVVPKG